MINVGVGAIVVDVDSIVFLCESVLLCVIPKVVELSVDVIGLVVVNVGACVSVVDDDSAVGNNVEGGSLVFTVVFNVLIDVLVGFVVDVRVGFIVSVPVVLSVIVSNVTFDVDETGICLVQMLKKTPKNSGSIFHAKLHFRSNDFTPYKNRTNYYLYSSFL